MTCYKVSTGLSDGTHLVTCDVPAFAGFCGGHAALSDLGLGFSVSARAARCGELVQAVLSREDSPGVSGRRVTPSMILAIATMSSSDRASDGDVAVVMLLIVLDWADIVASKWSAPGSQSGEIVEGRADVGGVGCGLLCLGGGEDSDALRAPWRSD